MSLRRALRALLRPRDAFDGWVPSLGVTLAVVVLLCVLNGASVAYAGDAVTSEVSGTVTVDNPERPPDWMCEDSTDGEFDSCNASETIQKPLRPAANSAITGVTMAAAFAPLAWVLLFASVFVVVSGNAGARDGEAVDAFRDGAGVAAIAAVPGVFRYLARPLAVERSLSDWRYPSSLDGVGPAAVDALFPEGTLWFAVVLLSGLWTAAVLYGGARGVFEVERGPAALSAVAAFLTTVVSVVLANGGQTDVPSGVGFLLLMGGVLGLLGARTYISISKWFELIGFGGSEKVTPKPWYVGLHRVAALCVLALGFVFLDGIALV